MARCLVGIALTIGMAAPLHAQVCAASGKDGPATISGVVNTYYPGTNSPAAGTNLITVGAATGGGTALQAGDLVLIIQMQDGVNAANFPNALGTYTTAANAAGVHEYKLVAGFDGTTITLHTNLVNSYLNAQTAGAARRTFQVVRVPQYSVATLPTGNTVSPTPWNGTTGGVVAIDVATTFTLSGTIEAAGYGFRGGAGRVLTGGTGAATDVRFSSGNGTGAMKGEGTAGSPRNTYASIGGVYTWAGAGGDFYPNGDNGYGAPGNAGGGGNDGNPGSNNQNSGGGGGGGAGAGGVGGNTWSSNLAVGGRGGVAVAQGITRIVMGGGGGAGTSNDGGTNHATFSGASGGGIVMVRAGAFAGNGRVNAGGANGQIPVTTCCDDGGTGGGGGGSAILLANSGGLGGITVDVRGGNGARTPNSSADHGPGGGGGGGAVLTSGGVASAIVTGGTAGAAYGSAGGSNGTVATNLAFTGSQGALPGASCRPELTVTKVTTTPARSLPTQWSAVYSIVVRNAGTAGAATGVAVADSLPAPFEAASTTAAASTVSAAGPAAAAVTGTGSVQIGVAGGTVANSYLILPGGAVTLTFSVDLKNAATGTYQNSATVAFSDPTRPTAATTVGPGNTYAGGGTVAGANYASGSSTGEDVVLTTTGTTNVVSTATMCPSDSVEAAGTNLVSNDDFMNTAGTLGQGGGVGLATLNTEPANDNVAYQTGYRTYTGGTAIAAQYPFPGDPARSVASTSNWVYANGNTLGVNTGIWWSQNVTGLTPGRSHTFMVYASSPIAPGSNQANPPDLRLRVTQAAASTVTLVNPSATSIVTNDAGTVDRWVLFQGVFTASQANATLAITNAATTTAAERNGQFAFTRPTLRTCDHVANLQVSKTNSATSVPAGGTTSYVITVTNSGPSSAPGTVVVDTPTAGLNCTTVTCSGSAPNMCPSASFPFSNLQSGIQIAPSFPSGQTATLTVTCGITATGQ